MIETKEGGRRQAPGWLMALLLLLCLGGAGWLTYYVVRPAPKPAPIVEDTTPFTRIPGGNRGGGNRPPGQGGGGGGPPSFFTRVKNKFNGGADRVEIFSTKHGYRIKGGSLIVDAIDPSAKSTLATTKPATTQPARYTFTFNPLWSDLLNQRDNEYRGIAYSIATSKSAADTAKADAQQVQQLKAAVPVIKLDPAAQAKLRALINTYASAAGPAKDAAEKTVVAAVQQLSSEQAPTLKQEGIAEAALVKKVLRPEQIAAIRERDNPTPTRTFARPTTRPLATATTRPAPTTRPLAAATHPAVAKGTAVVAPPVSPTTRPAATTLPAVVHSSQAQALKPAQ